MCRQTPNGYRMSDGTDGMTVINPGWTTYKPLTDYFGNTINYTTPNRGAIQ